MSPSEVSPSEALPGPQKYVQQWPFGQFSEVLGFVVAYCWGPGRHPQRSHKTSHLEKLREISMSPYRRGDVAVRCPGLC